ncbi:hypothetical protein IHN63_00470 [Deinococcus sp. 6YEL10]|uniref:hypothetical protein n=1 Tax=Deinococcus sp. 6YEL10 TaxID=2745870 RepID=UPI001E3DBF7C|nr:hypothetical protein [Deinococcus sp. 6YEL10]MCD0159773.1 hypothetical protein [Deinococcus sp. 6YEL10]
MRIAGYRAFVRRQHCLAARTDRTHRCVGAREAHHIREHAEAAYAAKPGDEHCVCLCQQAHNDYHHLGHEGFLRHYNVTEFDLWNEKLRVMAEYVELAVSRIPTR